MEQIDFLHHAVDTLERMKVPYIVVGSIASIAYGESRFTQDIDIVAALEPRHVEELLAAFRRVNSGWSTLPIRLLDLELHEGALAPQFKP